MSSDELGTFDGRDVVSTSIAIIRAGDGLSAALKVEPQLLHLGDKVSVVLDTEVAKIGYVPIGETEVLERVQTLRTIGATLIDRKLVAKALDEMARKIEQAKGLQRLNLDEGDNG